jgi:hypothetical protein
VLRPKGGGARLLQHGRAAACHKYLCQQYFGALHTTFAVRCCLYSRLLVLKLLLVLAAGLA